MSKGKYEVNEGENIANKSQQPKEKDTSFRSFICTLLIFLALCVIILLCTTAWGSSDSKKNRANQSSGELSDLKPEENHKPKEKLVAETTTASSRPNEKFLTDSDLKHSNDSKSEKDAQTTSSKSVTKISDSKAATPSFDNNSSTSTTTLMSIVIDETKRNSSEQNDSNSKFIPSEETFNVESTSSDDSLRPSKTTLSNSVVDYSAQNGFMLSVSDASNQETTFPYSNNNLETSKTIASTYGTDKNKEKSSSNLDGSKQLTVTASNKITNSTLTYKLSTTTTTVSSFVTGAISRSSFEQNSLNAEFVPTKTTSGIKINLSTGDDLNSTKSSLLNFVTDQSKISDSKLNGSDDLSIIFNKKSTSLSSSNLDSTKTTSYDYVTGKRKDQNNDSLDSSKQLKETTLNEKINSTTSNMLSTLTTTLSSLIIKENKVNNSDENGLYSTFVSSNSALPRTTLPRDSLSSIKSTLSSPAPNVSRANYSNVLITPNQATTLPSSNSFVTSSTNISNFVTNESIKQNSSNVNKSRNLDLVTSTTLLDIKDNYNNTQTTLGVATSANNSIQVSVSSFTTTPKEEHVAILTTEKSILLIDKNNTTNSGVLNNSPGAATNTTDFKPVSGPSFITTPKSGHVAVITTINPLLLLDKNVTTNSGSLNKSLGITTTPKDISKSYYDISIDDSYNPDYDSTIELQTNKDALTTQSPLSISTQHNNTSVVGVIQHQDHNRQPHNSFKECSSTECKTVASRMLGLIDHSKEPCDNFYNFACGNAHIDDRRKGTLERLYKNLYVIDDKAPKYSRTFKTFYESCLDHEQQFNYTNRVLQVKELIREVGWIIDEETSNDINITSLFAKLVLRQALPIFDVDIGIDSNLRYTLKIVPPSRISVFSESGRWSTLSENQIRCLLLQRDAFQQAELNLTKLHNDYISCQKDIESYVNSIQTVVENLGFYSNLTNVTVRSKQIQNLMISIELNILDNYEYLPLRNLLQKSLIFESDDDYHVIKVSDLYIRYPLLDWNTFFEILTGHKIENDTLIQEHFFIQFLSNTFTDLKNCNKKTINNVLIAMYAHDLYQNLVVSQARHDRERFCLKLTSKLFPDISNNLYVKTWNHDELKIYKETFSKTFTQLKNTFNKDLHSNDSLWINEISKIQLEIKIRNLNLILNKITDLYNNDTYLNLKYQNFVFGTQNWPSNANQMLKSYREMYYAIHGKSLHVQDLWSYFVNSYDDSPTSLYGSKIIIAPLGMMIQNPSKYPPLVQTAKIGLPLAREIGHHFDPVRMQREMILSVNSSNYYEYMTVIMTDIRVNSSVVGYQKVLFNVNGELSINERFADNVALRLLTKMFNASEQPELIWISRSFSKEQLFFISIAQEYCSKISMKEFMQKLFESKVLPSTLRVHNLVTNSETFSAAFQCGRDSQINKVSHKIQFPNIGNLDVKTYLENKILL